jgi:hypothetical protein
MRRSALSFILVSAVVAMSVPPAEALSIRWQTREGRVQTAAAIAPDGSIYTAGQERRSITAAATLTKWDAAGHMLWQRHWLPNADASTHPVAVTVENDGTVYLLGLARGSCEGQGWFIRAYTPAGVLRWKYLTPGWSACTLAESATDIAVRGHQVVVSGYSFGCCSDVFHDGWVQAFDRTLRPIWRTDVEPPSPTPSSWFDTATGVAYGVKGNVFVSGWGATSGAIAEGTPTPGTPVLEKLAWSGKRIWSVRAAVPVPSMFLPVSVDVLGDRVALAGSIHGKGVTWGTDPSTGWLASYTTTGVQRWQRRFGGGRDAAVMATGVALGEHGRVWVESTIRDPGDRGTDALVRSYGAKGAVIGKLRIDPNARYLASGGPATIGAGAVATGWRGTAFRFDGGRVWRVAA